MQELISPFWAAAGFQCYVGGHITQVFIAASLIAAFVLMAFLFTFLVFDSNPLSANPASKAHGHADVAFLACKVVLVILVEVWPHSVPKWLLVLVIFAAGIVWVTTYIALMPYYHHQMCVSTFRLNDHCSCLLDLRFLCPLQEPASTCFSVYVHVVSPLPVCRTGKCSVRHFPSVS